tara:strand:+ start:49 stop:204 length:156 start_codon:yes stop_codon:yes gene_type:complete
MGSTLKHRKAVDNIIKSPANLFVRALLVLDAWTERTVCCISLKGIKRKNES